MITPRAVREIDAEGEPDVLVGTREFPVERGVPVKLDPAIGAIVETWQMPDPIALPPGS